MSRQYFAEVTIDPPIANLTAVTASAAETALWNVAQFTPIHAFDAYKAPGKIYRVVAGGIYSTGANAGTIVITPRIGTTTSGITLGANTGVSYVISQTNLPWRLVMDLVVRTTGAPGANSTVIGTGTFSANTGTGATQELGINFGGTSATCDLSVETGLFIGWTWSAASNSITPQYVYMQSLN